MKKSIFNFRPVAILLAVTIVTFSACSDEDDDPGNNNNNNTPAQKTFEKTFSGCRSGWEVWQTSNKGYIMIGSTGSDLFSLRKTDLNGNDEWHETYGHTYYYGHSGQQTSDGGYIAVGYAEGSLTSNHGLYLIKTDADGQLSWEKTFPKSSTLNSEGSSVRQTTDGGYIVTGERYDNGVINVYLIKFDDMGEETWSKTFDMGDYSRGHCVRQTADGGYIIAGSNGLSTDVFLIKTNSSGDESWTETYTGYTFHIEQGNIVNQTADGGYIIACESPDATLVKTNSTGTISWTKAYDFADDPQAVQQTSDGGYILLAHTYSFGSGDIFLIKTNATGDTLWTNHFGSEDESEYPRCVQQTTDGGYILSGFDCNESLAYLIRTDADGRVTD